LRLALSTLLFVSSCCWGYLLFPGSPADNFEGPPNSIMVWRGGQEIIEETQTVTNFKGLVLLSVSDCKCIHGQAGAKSTDNNRWSMAARSEEPWCLTLMGNEEPTRIFQG
jgi:hypothetical protein